MLRRCLLAAVVLVCVGCGRPTFEDSSSIWSAVTNKTKAEVRSILGSPDAVQSGGGSGDQWIYKGIILDKASGVRQSAVVNFIGDKALTIDAL